MGGLLVLLAGCAGEGGPNGPDGGPLPAVPELVSPADGAQVAGDLPTFVVRNARGFDSGQAQYTIVVGTAGGKREIASFSAPAGVTTTTITAPAPLPRGVALAWRAVARSGASEVSSLTARFRLPAVECLQRGAPYYARNVVNSFLPPCSQQRNNYNDPFEVLGAPNASRIPGGPFLGFMSLGEKGFVTVDMEACAVDGPGADVRVWQAVSAEPVTLYVGGQRDGPFVLVEAEKSCGTRVTPIQGFCDFDLALADVQEARYLRIEDGELFPCELGSTDNEGADIDAAQLLNVRPATQHAP